MPEAHAASTAGTAGRVRQNSTLSRQNVTTTCRMMGFLDSVGSTHRVRSGATCRLVRRPLGGWCGGGAAFFPRSQVRPRLMALSRRGFSVSRSSAPGCFCSCRSATRRARGPRPRPHSVVRAPAQSRQSRTTSFALVFAIPSGKLCYVLRATRASSELARPLTVTCTLRIAPRLQPR